MSSVDSVAEHNYALVDILNRLADDPEQVERDFLPPSRATGPLLEWSMARRVAELTGGAEKDWQIHPSYCHFVIMTGTI